MNRGMLLANTCVLDISPLVNKCPQSISHLAEFESRPTIVANWSAPVTRDLGLDPSGRGCLRPEGLFTEPSFRCLRDHPSHQVQRPKHSEFVNTEHSEAPDSTTITEPALEPHTLRLCTPDSYSGKGFDVCYINPLSLAHHG